MKFQHKNVNVKVNELYKKEKGFDMDYNEVKKQYNKRMKELENSKKDTFDIMEKEYTDECFKLENIAGPGYGFHFENIKKYKLIPEYNKKKAKGDIKLNKVNNIFVITFSLFKGISFGGILTIPLTNCFTDGITTKSNIFFAVTSALITLVIYPIAKNIMIKEELANKIDCTNELLDLNGLYYDAGDEELDIGIAKVK